MASRFQVNCRKSSKSLRKLRQYSVRIDDRPQHRVRNNDFVLARGISANLITIEGDSQSGKGEIPTVEVLGFRPGALIGVVRRLQLLQFLDGVVRNDLEVIRIRNEEIGQIH